MVHFRWWEISCKNLPQHLDDECSVLQSVYCDGDILMNDKGTERKVSISNCIIGLVLGGGRGGEGRMVDGVCLYICAAQDSGHSLTCVLP